MLSIQRLLLASLPAALCATATSQHTPDDALRMLQDGNRRFAEERSVPQPIGEGVRRTLARGQSPVAVVVTCADSRVPPEHLFNTGLGELVVVRTAGHVVGSEAIATIEHAVERLNVPLCVVLGHEHCDVVGTAIRTVEEPDAPDRLSPAMVRLMERIEPSVRKALRRELAGDELHANCEEEHAHATVAECLRRSPLLRRFAELGRFRMVAARYHLGGEVEWLPHRALPARQTTEKQAVLGVVPASLPPHVALRMLRAGHNRFLGDHRPAPDLTRDRRDELSDGQQPLAIVVTDSDSRVSPEHVFDAGLGELFVVRTAGYTLTDETLASIEFAAGRLGASLLVIMGHDRCEPIDAANDHPEQQQLTPHQRELLRRLEPAVVAARGSHAADPVVAAARANVVRTLHETRSRSTLVRALEKQGRFAMLAAFYEVGTGDLHWLEAPTTTADVGTADVGQSHGQHERHAGEAHGDAVGSSEQAAHPTAERHHDAHAAAATPTGHSHDGSVPAAAHDRDGHAATLPVIDFHAAPAGETAAPSEHVDHHAPEHAPTAHDTAEAAEAATPDQHAQPTPHAEHDLLQRWLDPVVVVGMVGIVSLLGAAIVALRGKP